VQIKGILLLLYWGINSIGIIGFIDWAKNNYKSIAMITKIIF